MYQYFLYGINIHSDVKLYNIIESEGTAEAFIKIGKADSIEGEEKEGFIVRNDYARFDTNDCTIEVKNGNLITVVPKEGTDYKKVVAPVIGWGLAFLFSQRGCAAIHATALDIGGKGVLISGVSGAGKSTTALELVNIGYKYLVDDVAMLNVDENLII